MKKIILSVFAFLLFLPFAPNSPLVASGQTLIDTMVTDSINLRRREYVYNNSRDDDAPATTAARGNTKAAVRGNAKAAVRGKTTFSSTGSYIITKEIARKVGKTPAEKRDAEAGAIKALENFEGILKDNSFASNDVARASAVLFISCLNTYKESKMTRKQMDGVYAKFKDFYETDEYFQSLDDRGKQRTYEVIGFLWSMVFINHVKATETGDRASKQKAKDVAEQVFKQFLATSIKNVRMTADGFEVD